MPKPLDLSGQRFGKLQIVARASSRILSGKSATHWLCLCDCGAQCEVPTRRLPYDPAQAARLAARGEPAITACFACRAKTCPFCGDRFEGQGTVCSSPACQDVREKLWQKQHDAKRALERAEARQAKIAAMTPAEREEATRQHREQLRAWYQGIYADPQRHAQLKDNRRQYERNRAAAEFLEDAAKLEEKSR